MRVYHGTIAEFAKEIKKTGLLPMDKNKFAMEFDHPFYGRSESEEPTQVHVTPYPDIAVDYAKYRADYEKANPGKTVPFGTGDGYSEPLLTTKLGSKRHGIDTTPVVVTLDIPDYWNLQQDMGDDRGLVTDVPIPAQYIKEITPIA